MSLEFTLSAEVRSDYGKGASRRLRRTNKFPGIIYGGGGNPTPISLSHNEVLNNLQHEAFFSHILTLDLAGAKEQVIIKDIQRHPFKQQILHMDLQRVLANEAITVRVPLHYLNEETCHGVKTEGGALNKIENDVGVSCLPADLPEYIEVDVAELKLGESLHLSDIKLPDGVTMTDFVEGDEDHDRAIITVFQPRAAAEESADDEAAAEDGESGGESAAEESSDD
jgi:large subunit ribosomal protein L25